MQDLTVQLQDTDKMLLDALKRIKADVDDSLALRRYCREGVCGSDAMNINGKNGLACTINLNEFSELILLRLLSCLLVILGRGGGGAGGGGRGRASGPGRRGDS